MKVFLSHTFRTAIYATAVALLLTIVRIIGAGVLRRPDWAASTWITFLIVGFAAMFTSWRRRSGLVASLLTGYFFLWSTLLLINQPLIIFTYQRSILALIILLIITPFPLVLSAIVGTLLGRLLPRFRRKTPPENTAATTNK